MEKRVQSIIVRYGIIILFSFFGLFLLSKLLTPLTINVSFFLFDLFFEAQLLGNIILIDGFSLKLIAACIAIPAYYLLIILNLATPKLSGILRTKVFLFSLIGLLILNVLRIFFLGVLFINRSLAFEFVHLFLWYSVSILFVVGLWFLSVKIFNVKKIPFCTDAKELLTKIKPYSKR